MKEQMKSRVFEARVIIKESGMSLVKDQFNTLAEAIQDVKLREHYNDAPERKSYFVKEIITINHYL